MGKQKKTAEECKHPNSRKTLSLIKQIKRSSNKAKGKQNQAMKQNLLAEKILWFQSHFDESKLCYTASETEDVINLYLKRFDEELEQIKLKHSIGMRKNRQHASREDIITMTIKRDTEDFETCGLEIPNLMDPAQVKLLLSWNGKLRYLQNFKCKRFSKKELHLKKEKEVKTTVDVCNSIMEVEDNKDT